jgi:hypothetical protein
MRAIVINQVYIVIYQKYMLCEFRLYYYIHSGNLGSISSTFYEQLLRAQIPKAVKDTDDLAVFFRFWDLTT